MTDGENDGVAPSLDGVTATEKASREKFIEDGGPQRQPPDGQRSNKDRLTGIVSEKEEGGPIDPLMSR